MNMVNGVETSAIKPSKGRKLLLRAKRWIIEDILGTSDTPHRVALGLGIGVFVAFTPTIPFQTGLTVLLCFIFRANKIVGLPTIWITNPATIVPIYLPMYILGNTILGRDPQNLDWSNLLRTDLPLMEYAQGAWAFMMEIFAPLWVGSLIISSISGYLTYYVAFRLITKAKMRQQQRLLDERGEL